MSGLILAILIVAALIALTGAALAWLAENESADETERLVETLTSKLPQTQCAQCGYPGCRPYANAIVNDNAPINRCPPGGDALIKELSEFLGADAVSLDSACGETKSAQVAIIRETECIGCTLCIHACPVDAIIGASRYMHTVIADLCTGCELCLAPCPVDCIDLKPVETPLHQWQWPRPRPA